MGIEETLAPVTSVPRTVSEIFRDATGLEPTARLTLAQKNRRRLLAEDLNALVVDGDVHRRATDVVLSANETQSAKTVHRIEFWRQT